MTLRKLGLGETNRQENPNKKFPAIAVAWHGRPVAVLTGLWIAIVLVWIFTYGKWSPQRWAYPPAYRGDALYELGLIRAASLGHYTPIAWKIVPELGAPGEANWNDYPQTEDFLYAVLGKFAAVFGLMPAANLALLLAFLLNGTGFYWACRLLRYRSLWSLVGAMLFAFSHYASSRGLGHLELTYYAHLPLALVATWWLGGGAIRDFRDPKAVFTLAVAAWSGLQNTYYTYLIAQLLLFSILANIVRAKSKKGEFRAAFVGFAVLATLVSTFIIGNLDTLTYRWWHGPNTAAIVRQYEGTEIYALKPIELFLTTWPGHWFHSLAESYSTHAIVRGEINSPYLGVIGVGSLLALVIFGFTRVARGYGLGTRMPKGLYQLMWIFSFSVVGGINSIIAICGFDVFRATNRYSIFVLTIALLFFVRMAALFTRRWPQVVQFAVASAIVTFGVVDQARPSNPQGEARMRSRVKSDRMFTAALERQLPAGSAVFQLPVADYPEQGPIQQMEDYSHLRSFFYTAELRFSYGDDKGRGGTDWQRRIETMPTNIAVQQLRQKGFSAVIVDCDGYADKGTMLIEDFQREGAKVIARAQEGDFVALKLP